MHDADVVRGLQRVRHLDEDVHRPGHWEGALPLEHVGERLSLDEFHREVDQALGRLAEVVDSTDARVADAARVGCFAIEARHGVWVVDHGGVQYLDGALPPHLHMLGKIHLPHAPLAELLEDVVASATTCPTRSCPGDDDRSVCPSFGQNRTSSGYSVEQT